MAGIEERGQRLRSGAVGMRTTVRTWNSLITAEGNLGRTDRPFLFIRFHENSPQFTVEKDSNQDPRQIGMGAVYYIKLYLWKQENHPVDPCWWGLRHGTKTFQLFLGGLELGVLQSSFGALLPEFEGFSLSFRFGSGETCPPVHHGFPVDTVGRSCQVN